VPGAHHHGGRRDRRDDRHHEERRLSRQRIPLYLRPYLRARRSAGVTALLWDDRTAQRVRFEAIARLVPLDGLHVLDVGCGRADLLRFLRARGIAPARYTGLEAQAWLAREAFGADEPGVSIVLGDFVKQPGKLRVGADAIVFSGSLNLLSAAQFYRTLERAWAATGRFLIFNFLSSPILAGEEFLMWRRRDSVLAFARRNAVEVRIEEGYEYGDCTVAMRKPRASARVSGRSRTDGARRG
jgi:hypothetical protein